MKKILENKKRFEKPILEIIDFANDDIITGSGDFGSPGQGGNDVFPTGWWGGDNPGFPGNPVNH